MRYVATVSNHIQNKNRKHVTTTRPQGLAGLRLRWLGSPTCAATDWRLPSDTGNRPRDRAEWNNGVAQRPPSVCTGRGVCWCTPCSLVVLHSLRRLLDGVLPLNDAHRRPQSQSKRVFASFLRILRRREAKDIAM